MWQRWAQGGVIKGSVFIECWHVPLCILLNHLLLLMRERGGSYCHPHLTEEKPGPRGVKELAQGHIASSG